MYTYKVSGMNKALSYSLELKSHELFFPQLDICILGIRKWAIIKDYTNQEIFLFINNNIQ